MSLLEDIFGGTSDASPYCGGMEIWSWRHRGDTAITGRMVHGIKGWMIDLGQSFRPKGCFERVQLRAVAV